MKLWMAASLALALFPAVAAAQAPTDTRARDRILQRFDNCVLTVSIGVPGERNMAAEQSFMACQTEEEAVRTFLALNYVPFPTIEAIVVRRKLELKKIIRSDPH